MGNATRIEWSAEQVCGECGEGVFANHRGQAICTACEHEHPMDPTNLDEREAFVWTFSTQEAAHRHGQTLHVVSYA